VAATKRTKRDLFGELMEGVSAMRSHREGRVTLRSHQIERLTLPPIDEQIIRSTRERLHMSRSAFAFRIGVNPRTLERWEQGRSKPNDQAAALIFLVRKYPDMLKRLQQLATAS
jgi:putative transcriptional regulator